MAFPISRMLAALRSFMLSPSTPSLCYSCQEPVRGDFVKATVTIDGRRAPAMICGACHWAQVPRPFLADAVERQVLRRALDPAHEAEAALIAALDLGVPIEIVEDKLPTWALIDNYRRHVDHLEHRRARMLGGDDVMPRLLSAGDRVMKRAFLDTDRYHVVAFLDVETGAICSCLAVPLQHARDVRPRRPPPGLEATSPGSVGRGHSNRSVE